MRETKFRGFSKEENDWLYGLYLQKAPSGGMRVFDHAIVSPGYYGKEIDVDSLGLFTGRYDTDEVEIYEGDIMQVFNPRVNHMKQWLFEVRWNENDLQFQYWNIQLEWFATGNHNKPYLVGRSKHGSTCEVIGNIYQNPNLIK